MDIDKLLFKITVDVSETRTKHYIMQLTLNHPYYDMIVRVNSRVRCGADIFGNHFDMMVNKDG